MKNFETEKEKKVAEKNMEKIKDLMGKEDEERNGGMGEERRN